MDGKLEGRNETFDEPCLSAGLGMSQVCVFLLEFQMYRSVANGV